MSLRFLKFTFATLAIFIVAASGAHAAGAAEPSSSDPSLPLHGLNMGDATGVGSMLQFTPVESEPMACTAHMRGALALTQRMRLCVSTVKHGRLRITAPPVTGTPGGHNHGARAANVDGIRRAKTHEIYAPDCCRVRFDPDAGAGSCGNDGNIFPQRRDEWHDNDLAAGGGGNVQL